MAMSESGLSGRIMDVLTFGGFTQSAENKKLADAIAKAVIDEIKANMVTTTVVAGGSSAGTYTGTSE